MQRILALCAAVLLLASCSQQASVEDLADGNCTSTRADLVNKHISGQIDALAEKDWGLAHSFASDNFQASVSVDDFTQIISAQYPMLVENKGYQFNACTVEGNTITQEISVTSDEQVFSLTYKLTLTGPTLGIESAVISNVAPQINI